MVENDSGPVPRPAQPAVRFAPSPTGPVHLGTALSALFTSEVAKALDARFILRIEDIDTARSRPEHITSILDDLAWLGLEWEEPVRRQSEHMTDYRTVIDSLAARGLLYPCYATRSELAEAAARAGPEWPQDPDGTPLHPGRGKVIPADVEEKRIAAGETPALRLDMARAMRAGNAGKLTFQEIGDWASHTGPVSADPGRWGDVVIARKDIGTSYHLSVVVDDALQGVSHVTRGMDLYEATHLQRLLQQLIGLPAPVYAHHPLIFDDDGRKLGKSVASASIASLRASGASATDIRAASGIEQYRGWLGRLAAQPVSKTFPDEEKDQLNR